MKIKFLGTSAAHSYPLPFCNCNICVKARQMGDKNMRKRSSVLINDDLIIDLGPDFTTAAFMHQVDTTAIRHWLQTYCDSESFGAAHVITRMGEYAVEGLKPLFLFASPETIQDMSDKLAQEKAGANLIKTEWLEKLGVVATAVKHGKEYVCGSYAIIPFDTNQNKTVYFIADDTCKLFYALNTDKLTTETLDYFSEHRIVFDVVILDHTYGFNVYADGHLNANNFIKTIAKMKERGIITEQSKVYASHISHEGNLPHDEFLMLAKKHGYEVAYDGLEIIV
ncbi:MAG: hypothetical protein FWH20_05855 [Oscillospiraceae bacterium]|nr:hypothetical protein [Oscillospiraceae bacterium]